ncbi:MAG: transposase [Thaumarchaeota archaeon]|nr:transposase [Nitrososphaerota archaeon]
MSGSSYQVRAYNIRHRYYVSEFLEAYRRLLQKAVDEIWAKIRWVEKRDEKGRRRLIPIIPKDNIFKNHYLRNLLMEGWGYSKHYVDSAIKQAYSIIKSWRRSYVKGERRREKPVVKRRFVRVKETLYTFKDGEIKVSVKPHEEYLVFDISKAWFLSRAEGEPGELILGEKYLTVTFRFKAQDGGAEGKVAWDCNEKSLDGFSPNTGWIRIDLTKLFHIHRVYELKRKRLQQKASKKPSLRRVLAKYSKRERNRAKDYFHKLTTFIARGFKGYTHGFEHLGKNRMLNGSNEHNRNISKSDWKTIITLMSYKSKVVLLNPKNSTRRCSGCGMVNAPKGAIFECEKCGLKMDRQLNAAINLYLQMEGLPPTPNLFDELMRGWSGFTLTGEEADEGSNELKRSLKLLNPKSYVSLLMTT